MPTHYQGTPEEIKALNAFIKFTRAYNSLEARLFGGPILEGLTESQFGVLEALLHLGPLPPGVLSKKLLKSTGNMTMVLDNLEKRRLIRRIRSEEDRRVIHIHLTDTGRELISRLFPTVVKAIQMEMKKLSPTELAQLGTMCEKMGKGD